MRVKEIWKETKRNNTCDIVSKISYCRRLIFHIVCCIYLYCVCCMYYRLIVYIYVVVDNGFLRELLYICSHYIRLIMCGVRRFLYHTRFLRSLWNTKFWRIDSV